MSDTGYIATPEHRQKLSAARAKFCRENPATLAKRQQLHGLIEQGFTNKAAGEIIGVCKSAVSGMLYRMRSDGVVINRPVKERQAKPVQKPVWVRSKVRAPPQPRRHIQHPPMTPCGLLERTGCAFPVAYELEHKFCNNEVHFPTSYCLFHGNLMVSG